MKTKRDWVWWIGGKIPVGYTHDVVELAGEPYLERRIVWIFGLLTLRWHTFWHGDQERYQHDHPWWFITFPLTTYGEHYLKDIEVAENGVVERWGWREVKAWRPHFRSAKCAHRIAEPDVVPIHTLVLGGWYSNKWGFIVRGKHVYHRDMNVEGLKGE